MLRGFLHSVSGKFFRDFHETAGWHRYSSGAHHGGMLGRASYCDEAGFNGNGTAYGGVLPLSDGIHWIRGNPGRKRQAAAAENVS